MKEKQFLSSLIILLMMWTIILNVEAQVTIGSGETPQNFSILEIVSNSNGGLRLPHLTTSERNTLSSTADFQAQAQRGDATNSIFPGLGLGLTIYNTDVNCIEYWDGLKWISLCLGTADITLESPCGDYDKNNPPLYPANGAVVNCEYTPKDKPECIVPSGKAYEVYLAAGDAYASLQVDELTSAFSITFQPNNSSKSRNVVVRITNNCSGEFQDFLFLQEGETCTGAPDPTLNSTSRTLCSGGSVFARVTNPVTNTNYVWTFGGVVIHTGVSYEIKRAGTYKVYSGLLGCGTPATLTVDNNLSNAEPATTITATNGGILCDGGSVILKANTTSNVLWFQNDVPLTGSNKNNNPLTISGGSAAGNWFAVVDDGTCTSTSSNRVEIKDQTSGSTALAIPKMIIDGIDISGGGTPTFCQNASVILQVGNASSYPVGALFEWFINGVSQGVINKSWMVYNIPNGTTSMSVSVQVTNQGVNCPSTTVAPTQSITFMAPNNTLINNGAAKAYICGGTPALLVAAFQTGVDYEWFLDDTLISGASSANYEASVLGAYKVRYKDSNGCWSKFSTSILVENSSAISMAWGMQPGDSNNEVIYDVTESYSVLSAPIADSYIWKAIRADGITEIPIYPSNNGSVATITYPNLGAPATETITISVRASNGCGSTTISKKVTLRAGCTPVNSVNITPGGTTKLVIGDPNKNKMTFTATSNGATDYEWKINGITVGTNQATYTYTAASIGSYTLSVTASGCEGSASTSVNIDVQPDLSTIVEETPMGNYSLTGKSCYDVNQGNTTTCGPLSGRKDDFASTKTFYYNFVNTGVYSELSFYIEDNNAIVASTSHPNPATNKVFEVVFRNDINTYITNNGDALLTIIAVYKNNADEWRKITKVVKIQDCSCCGAYISASEWKVFKCHNLGANEAFDPFVVRKEILGNYYQWGRATVVANTDTPEGSISGWNTTYAPDKAWDDNAKTPNDPCPDGFRVPKKADWDGIIAQTAKNPQSTTGTWTSASTNYTSGRYIGEGLLLPANGSRDFNNGALNVRGKFGYYWTSRQNSSSTGFFMFISSSTALVSNATLTYGYSVRCIAE